MTIDGLRCALRGVAAYKHLMDEPLMELSTSLLDALSAGRGVEAVERYTSLFFALRVGGWAGMGQWLCDKLRYEQSPYATLVEQAGSDPALEAAAQRDVEVFGQLAGLDCESVILRMKELVSADFDVVLDELPRWTAEVSFDFDMLTEFYRINGAGIFAQYRAFLWEKGRILPVAAPDCPAPEEMLGYELQRDQVVANTRAMMKGNRVNNVLLYGDSGTGKSAAVKALLQLDGLDDLRLIEVSKQDLAALPVLIRMLAGRRYQFILFIDDLAFDQDDRSYSALKTILEGGLEPRPANVAIYATSNRRHLVRQTFSDRAGDEVDATETIQEKTSLADRFGLRIPYLTLNKVDFLDMVERMAALYGVEMEREKLRAEAVKWEMHYPGRTPRTAKQFIASLKQ